MTSSQSSNTNKTIAVDLGCGANPKNPFNAETLIGIDFNIAVEDKPGLISSDIALEGIPLPDSSVDYVTAIDFLEHIQRTPLYKGETCIRNPFIFVMNEISRVLKKGGLFMHQTPSYPKDECFMDPTHVNPIVESTIIYFAKAYNKEGIDVGQSIREISESYGIKTRFIFKSSRWIDFRIEQILEKY